MVSAHSSAANRRQACVMLLLLIPPHLSRNSCNGNSPAAAPANCDKPAVGYSPPSPLRLQQQLTGGKMRECSSHHPDLRTQQKTSISLVVGPLPPPPLRLQACSRSLHPTPSGSSSGSPAASRWGAARLIALRFSIKVFCSAPAPLPSPLSYRSYIWQLPSLQATNFSILVLFCMLFLSNLHLRYV